MWIDTNIHMNELTLKELCYGKFVKWTKSLTFFGKLNWDLEEFFCHHQLKRLIYVT